MNAISPELLEGLDAARGDEADPGIGAVALTGSGRAFCAGADLKVVQELAPDPEGWRTFMDLWHRVFDRLERLPVPVVAGVHGLALAGGLELMLVCDLVVADEEARLGDQHVNFALVAGGGGSQRLPRPASTRRPRSLMLLGGWIDARCRPSAGASSTAWRRRGPCKRRRWPLARESRRRAAGERHRQAPRRSRPRPPTCARGSSRSGWRAEHMRGDDAQAGLRAFAERRLPAS
jgi:enoyl-CoA hydratase/carnithine racemase